ncbi:hypothetical protein H072_8713 [Dactylellina haptotyla CBS 200.50]|uniref:GAR domain-containing protein n=1 Tax=Dactylellina haptotyla (strain CBS 200.50) TaxID=1284197 RepID=S8BE97_DACHA|nr:hypothetical protein H072_8713 [Dactylellina haptotyla CBS 200.50]
MSSPRLPSPLSMSFRQDRPRPPSLSNPSSASSTPKSASPRTRMKFPSSSAAASVHDPLLSRLTPTTITKMSDLDFLPGEKEVGVWAATASEKIENYLREVENWEEATLWVKSDGDGFRVPERGTARKKRRKVDLSAPLTSTNSTSRRDAGDKKGLPVARRLFTQSARASATSSSTSISTGTQKGSVGVPGLHLDKKTKEAISMSQIDELLSPTTTPLLVKRLDFDLSGMTPTTPSRMWSSNAGPGTPMSPFSPAFDKPNKRRSLQVGVAGGMNTPTTLKRQTFDFTPNRGLVGASAVYRPTSSPNRALPSENGDPFASVTTTNNGQLMPPPPPPPTSNPASSAGHSPVLESATDSETDFAQTSESEIEEEEEEGEPGGGAAGGGGIDTEFLGSLTNSTLTYIATRIGAISADLSQQDIEGLKSRVLHFKSQQIDEQGNGRMSDSLAIITATTLQLLPPLHRLWHLLEVWGVRVEVCRVVPAFLGNLGRAEGVIMKKKKKVEALMVGEDEGGRWLEEIEEGVGEAAVNEVTLRTLEGGVDVVWEKRKTEVVDLVGVCGKIIDGMLDLLDGREETVPEEWIDRLEAVEAALEGWVFGEERRADGLKRRWREVVRHRREEEERRRREEVQRLRREELERRRRGEEEERLRKEEEERLRVLAEEERIRKEEEERLRKEEEEKLRRKREEERLRLEEEERLRKAEAERLRQEEEDRLRNAEEEFIRQAEEDARLHRLAEEARLKQEEAERFRAEFEEQQKRDEEARRELDAEEELSRRLAEEEAERRKAEERRIREIEERMIRKYEEMERAEEEARKQAEAAAAEAAEAAQAVETASRDAPSDIETEKLGDNLEVITNSDSPQLQVDQKEELEITDKEVQQTASEPIAEPITEPITDLIAEPIVDPIADAEPVLTAPPTTFEEHIDAPSEEHINPPAEEHTDPPSEKHMGLPSEEHLDYPLEEKLQTVNLVSESALKDVDAVFIPEEIVFEEPAVEETLDITTEREPPTRASEILLDDTAASNPLEAEPWADSSIREAEISGDGTVVEILPSISEDLEEEEREAVKVISLIAVEKDNISTDTEIATLDLSESANLHLPPQMRIPALSPIAEEQQTPLFALADPIAEIEVVKEERSLQLVANNDVSEVEITEIQESTKIEFLDPRPQDNIPTSLPLETTQDPESVLSTPELVEGALTLDDDDVIEDTPSSLPEVQRERNEEIESPMDLTTAVIDDPRAGESQSSEVEEPEEPASSNPEEDALVATEEPTILPNTAADIENVPVEEISTKRNDAIVPPTTVDLSPSQNIPEQLVPTALPTQESAQPVVEQTFAVSPLLIPTIPVIDNREVDSPSSDRGTGLAQPVSPVLTLHEPVPTLQIQAATPIEGHYNALDLSLGERAIPIEIKAPEETPIERVDPEIRVIVSEEGSENPPYELKGEDELPVQEKSPEYSVEDLPVAPQLEPTAEIPRISDVADIVTNEKPEEKAVIPITEPRAQPTEPPAKVSPYLAPIDGIDDYVSDIDDSDIATVADDEEFQAELRKERLGEDSSFIADTPTISENNKAVINIPPIVPSVPMSPSGTKDKGKVVHRISQSITKSLETTSESKTVENETAQISSVQSPVKQAKPVAPPKLSSPFHLNTQDILSKNAHQSRYDSFDSMASRNKPLDQSFNSLQSLEVARELTSPLSPTGSVIIHRVDDSFGQSFNSVLSDDTIPDVASPRLDRVKDWAEVDMMPDTPSIIEEDEEEVSPVKEEFDEKRFRYSMSSDNTDFKLEDPQFEPKKGKAIEKRMSVSEKWNSVSEKRNSVSEKRDSVTEKRNSGSRVNDEMAAGKMPPPQSRPRKSSVSSISSNSTSGGSSRVSETASRPTRPHGQPNSHVRRVSSIPTIAPPRPQVQKDTGVRRDRSNSNLQRHSYVSPAPSRREDPPSYQNMRSDSRASSRAESRSESRASAIPRKASASYLPTPTPPRVPPRTSSFEKTDPAYLKKKRSTASIASSRDITPKAPAQESRNIPSRSSSRIASYSSLRGQSSRQSLRGLPSPTSSGDPTSPTFETALRSQSSRQSLRSITETYSHQPSSAHRQQPYQAPQQASSPIYDPGQKIKVVKRKTNIIPSKPHIRVPLNGERDDGIKSPTSPIGFPTLRSMPSVHSTPMKGQELEDRLERKINKILVGLPSLTMTPSPMKKMVPPPINTAIEPPVRQPKFGESKLPIARTPSTPTIGQAPNLTISSKRTISQPGEVKMYHLHKSDEESPVKLFVRLVGDRGERVMVRVGGGWADLKEYLIEYASHHGIQGPRKIGSEGFVEFGEDARSIRASNSNSSLRSSFRGSPTPTFGNSSRPSSPLPGSKLPAPSSSRGNTPRAESPFLNRRPDSPGGRSQMGNSPGLQYGLQSSRGQQQLPRASPVTPNYDRPVTPGSAGLHPSYASPTFNTALAANFRRPTSRLSFGDFPDNAEGPPSSPIVPSVPLGLAGPKSKNLEISAEKQAWVDGMLGQVRKASAERNVRLGLPRMSSGGNLQAREDDEGSNSGIGTVGTSSGPRLSDMGKVGGTRRMYATKQSSYLGLKGGRASSSSLRHSEPGREEESGKGNR